MGRRGGFKPVQKKRRFRPKNNRVKYAWIAAGCALIVMLGIGMVALFSDSIPAESRLVVRIDDGKVVSGVAISGVDVSGKTPQEIKTLLADQEKKEQEELVVTLKINDREEQQDLSVFGVVPNTDEVIAQAMLVGRSGSMKERQQAEEDAKQTPVALEFGYTYDKENLRQNIRDNIDKVNAGAIEPTAQYNASTGTFDFIEGKDGIEIDVDAFVELLAEEIESGEFGTIVVPGTPVKAKYTVEDIKANTSLVATYTTKFKVNNESTRNREHNIKTAADKLTGAVVMPGETFSVNDTIGPRTDPEIWAAAKGIENGVYVDQLGGGICQVSTTLFNSLMMSDMKITERRPHSIPASYVDKGRDAMISTGGPDLKFVNTSDWPVYLRIYVTDQGGSNRSVTAEIWGKPLEDGMTIELEAVTTETIEFDPTPVYVTNEELVRPGRNGYKAEVYKVYRDKNGKEIKRVLAHRSTYAKSSPRELDPKLLPSPTPSATPGATTAPTPSTTAPAQTTAPPAA